MKNNYNEKEGINVHFCFHATVQYFKGFHELITQCTASALLRRNKNIYFLYNAIKRYSNYIRNKNNDIV